MNADYEGYSAVGGHGYAKPEHWSRDVLASVDVISDCDLIIKLVPGYWQMPDDKRPSYEELGRLIKEWCEANGAHFFSWEGCSFGRGAMENEARANAAALGKRKVVVEALS